MDFARQARSREARACLQLAERAERSGRPRLETAWLYAHALELLCDLGLQNEAFRRCLCGLGRLHAASQSVDDDAPRRPIGSRMARAASKLEIKAFGSLRVNRGRGQVLGPAWHGSKALDLLKLLVCSGEDAVPYEVAIESLW